MTRIAYGAAYCRPRRTRPDGVGMLIEFDTLTHCYRLLPRPTMGERPCFRPSQCLTTPNQHDTPRRPMSRRCIPGCIRAEEGGVLC